MLQNDPIKNLQKQSDLRISQPTRVEPIVYQSNTSIISSEPAANQQVSSISNANDSNRSLSSYLPHSGLNVLRDMPSLHIHQVYELNDMLTTVSSENRYTVRTPGNEAIFAGSEGSEPRDRTFWGSSRPFTMHVVDRSHQEIFTMSRTFGMRFICFPVKYQRMEVWMNNSTYIGSVSEKFSIFDRFFTIDNDQGQALYRMDVGGQESCCMPKEASFKILSLDRCQQIATITRLWNIDISSYTINIYFNDVSLDPKIKAVLLSAGFLLEYLYFQSSCC